jgi:hypothetical protein
MQDQLKNVQIDNNNKQNIDINKLITKIFQNVKTLKDYSSSQQQQQQSVDNVSNFTIKKIEESNNVWNNVQLFTSVMGTSNSLNFKWNISELQNDCLQSLDLKKPIINVINSF